MLFAVSLFYATKAILHSPQNKSMMLCLIIQKLEFYINASLSVLHFIGKRERKSRRKEERVS